MFDPRTATACPFGALSGPASHLSAGSSPDGASFRATSTVSCFSGDFRHRLPKPCVTLPSRFTRVRSEASYPPLLRRSQAPGATSARAPEPVVGCRPHAGWENHWQLEARRHRVPRAGPSPTVEPPDGAGHDPSHRARGRRDRHHLRDRCDRPAPAHRRPADPRGHPTRSRRCGSSRRSARPCWTRATTGSSIPRWSSTCSPRSMPSRSRWSCGAGRTADAQGPYRPTGQSSAARRGAHPPVTSITATTSIVTATNPSSTRQARGPESRPPRPRAPKPSAENHSALPAIAPRANAHRPVP